MEKAGEMKKGISLKTRIDIKVVKSEKLSICIYFSFLFGNYQSGKCNRNANAEKAKGIHIAKDICAYKSLKLLATNMYKRYIRVLNKHEI